MLQPLPRNTQPRNASQRHNLQRGASNSARSGGLSRLLSIVPYAAAGAAACLLDALLLEPNSLRLNRAEIVLPNLPAAFDGYRIALLADLHYPRWTDRAFIQRALALANGFDPDLLIVAGDICDRSLSESRAVPSLAGLFEGARARDGVLATLGNHDHRYDLNHLRREIAEHTPLRLLENEAFMVERDGERLAVGGVGDLQRGIVNPKRTFEGVPPGVPRLLISHNPDLAERLDPGLKVELMLSGHTHGGQVNLPFLPAPWIGSRYGKKFRAGLVRGKGCQVYVTRGVASVRHVRFLCRPEVTGITLRRAKSSSKPSD